MTEVRVHADRVELCSGGVWRSFPFLSFARGREIGSRRVPIGELHFSKTHYSDSHFIFYATARLTIYMPADGPSTYPESHFWRVQEVVREGGFRLYADGPPKLPPRVLDPRPVGTVSLVLGILVFSWLYGLSGFLPGAAGAAARHHLLGNPGNPSIGLAFMLPATLMPLLLGLRHGRSAGRILLVIGFCFVLALGSEWVLRGVIRSWAALDGPPFNLRFWTVHWFVTELITVAVAAVIGAGWRRAYLEPIPDAQGGRGRPCRDDRTDVG